MHYLNSLEGTLKSSGINRYLCVGWICFSYLLGIICFFFESMLECAFVLLFTIGLWIYCERSLFSQTIWKKIYFYDNQFFLMSENFETFLIVKYNISIPFYILLQVNIGSQKRYIHLYRSNFLFQQDYYRLRSINYTKFL